MTSTNSFLAHVFVAITQGTPNCQDDCLLVAGPRPQEVASKVSSPWLLRIHEFVCDFRRKAMQSWRTMVHQSAKWSMQSGQWIKLLQPKSHITIGRQIELWITSKACKLVMGTQKKHEKTSSFWGPRKIWHGKSPSADSSQGAFVFAQAGKRMGQREMTNKRSCQSMRERPTASPFLIHETIKHPVSDRNLRQSLTRSSQD